MVKRFWLAFAIILGLVFTTGASLGDLKILKRERFIFDNNNCEDSASCNLRQINYLIEDYRVEMDSGFHYGTRMSAEYETNTIGNLEDYVFVQFIKGCMYSSEVREGQMTIIQSYIEIGRDNVPQPIIYPDWYIESVGSYPIYYSYPDFPRQYFYLWNTTSNLFNNKSDQFYGEHKPPYPRLYVRDRPGTAFVFNGVAKNISLQFKTCLYKSADISSVMNENRQIDAEPIHCYQWSSSWIYNHNTEEYNTPYGISTACK